MFKSLVKRLFRSIKGDSKPNYFYFESDKSSEEEIKKQEPSPLQSVAEVNLPVLLNLEERHQQDFYDFLFGKSPQTINNNELSKYVADKVEALLKQPKSMLNVMPVLPVSLTMVIEKLNDDDFDIDVLLNLIQQEPSIAAKVIELANSSFYNRNNKEITELKSAFMLLGRNGLIEGVINGFVSKLTPQSKIYFKQYGNKIWQHSLATGVITKELINNSIYKDKSAQGYLIGLICNLGDMIIYQLLMEAFSFVHPECQPNSYSFKVLLQKKSKVLTYHIAKHWQFPESILDALAVQVKLTKSSMLPRIFRKRTIACYVYEANIISELSMMLEFKSKTEEQISEMAVDLLYSNEAKQKIEMLLSNNATLAST